MLPRKILLMAFLGVCFSTDAFSQFVLGIKVSPSISTNRINSSGGDASFDTDGNGLRLIVGPIADFQIKENYYFSTGLLFESKRVGITANTDNGEITEKYGLQYLQVPVTLKLFTNEVALDKKIYFQVGGAPEFKVYQSKDDSNVLIDKFRFFDTSLIIGVGMEYKVGVTTTIFGGFTYQRGLINAIKDHTDLSNDLSLKNDYISLDLGVKF